MHSCSHRGHVGRHSVYALDTMKNFEEYEKFKNMLKRALFEGRRDGARRYLMDEGFNEAFGTVCIEDDEEVKEIYGQRCPYGIQAVLKGINKTMWLEI